MKKLSADQQQAVNHILDWYKQDRDDMQHITLGGYAGTGKTTLIGVLRNEFQRMDSDISVGFCSFTGKAARVLHSKLKEQQALRKGDSVSTIHALIYSPVVNEREEIVGWSKKEAIDKQLIIIDEASMVNESIWRDIVGYGIPIIAVGDHGQLPPIQGKLNLMEKPDLTLTEIHRQAQHNPIIALSIKARTQGHIPHGQYADTVQKYSRGNGDTQEHLAELFTDYSSDMLVLCGYNATRKRLNGYIRQLLGFETVEPIEGDRVICLRNNHKKAIYNGMLGTILEIEKKSRDWYSAVIQMDGEERHFAGLISVQQFNADSALNYSQNRKNTMAGDLFDFGYALTVHKAQGSQAQKVVLFEERFSKMDDEMWRRWLYTGVTRAEEELYVVG